MTASVLLVDDMDDSLEALEEYLKFSGISVVGKANDGRKAGELYSQLKPDMVLIDIVMPLYDGLYAFNSIKELDPHAKIIMVTGYPDYKTEQELLSMGARAIIYKPLDGYTVLTIINKVKNGEKLEAS